LATETEGVDQQSQKQTGYQQKEALKNHKEYIGMHNALNPISSFYV